ncbi:hypothetical protein JG687_00000884 [Phytophthora cactorum]|uniref:SH2 domain-containing protein n=1 Tax=Phytophthora cactorum TaxID=29920 RepID=A0A8T1V3K8_9STRA|nr:hypothetical protein JG687_00000884 [Phytophthora cactorum]
MHGGGSSTRLDGNVGGHGDYPPATSVAHTLQYTPSARLKIFLSLQRRGHVVWLDIEKLSAGIDWEEGIAGGLSWVRDAGSDGRVLLVMTPHALRRPDGYCLNEVARAASLRLNIFPVMVAESAPPPSIAILPFFDMRDCVPGDVEQETHAKDSQEWRDLMKSCLETSTFLDKAERLYTILELFDSITSYGVPAVAGTDVFNIVLNLKQATGEDCMQLVAAFAADEKFQLARRLLHVRAEGLQSFFHGDISREKAQELLARRQPHRVGSFLIRYTSRQRTYCASFVTGLDEATGAPKFRHNLIHHLENGSYSTVPQAEVTEKTILYPDLISFVEQYQRKGVLTAPVARDAPLNREISR